MKIHRVALIFDNRARPETTGVYCRRALGRWLEVEHFLPTELDRVPRRGFDLYLNVDDGLEYRLPAALRPCAWWAIDTHLNFEWCSTKAADFDSVFAAQRDGAERLRASGIASARWLPLACDPEIHRRHPLPKERDVAFVGNLFPGARSELVGRILERHPDSFVGRAYFDEMARLYSSSRIVFNRSIRDDINMRVFEALACGSLLVTNDLAENGQDELFVPGTHLVTYRDAEELLRAIGHHLEHPGDRERIAAIGRREVLANHTYRHRMETLVAAVEEEWGRTFPAASPAQPRPRATPDLSYFAHARPELMAMVPTTARSVLDIGCGVGRLGEALKARQGCRVVGIEYDRTAAELAADRIDRVVVGDADELEPDFLPGEFDVVVCGDILEHLRDPDNLLRKARRWLSTSGLLVASIPNVRHRSVAASLLLGNWTYESAGLLDRDHVRFFTRREVEKLFYRAGFRVESLGSIPGPGDGGWLDAGRPNAADIGPIRLEGLTPGDAEEFHAYQYLVAAVPEEDRDRDRSLTSIIVLTHNELAYTKACVDSLERFTDLPHELIFVDNASTDGTVDYLRTIPGASVIENAENRGFPAGVNQGLAVASGDQILLLNNDTVVTTGWLGRILDVLDRDPTIGLVGPCSNNVSGPQQIRVAYENMGDLDGFAWDWGRAHHGQAMGVDRLVGFCLLFRREVWESIGGLDERFGVGCFEDDDFCRRALARGWRAVIARDAFVHHFGSRTFLGSGADFAAILRENEGRYLEKWGGEGSKVGEDARTVASPPAEGMATIEGKPILSACLIVRDNASTLPACLESIRPWVDELVVVDTGSVDETPGIAESFGARIFEFPWCDDFSAARNESFRHARGSWLFWMDSDDTIPPECGRKLRELSRAPARPDVLGYVMQVHCPGGGADGGHDVTVVDHIKLVRNRPDVRFEFRIHEQVLPSIRRAGGEVEWTDIYVVHSGSDPGPEAQERKRRRDLRILHLEDAERPDHPFNLFNLGMTHADGGEFARAAEYLIRAVTLSSPDDSHLRKSYALLVYSLAHSGRRAEAIETCDRALGLFPTDAELRFRRGVLLHDSGRFAEAAAVYEDLLARPDDRHFSSVDRGIAGFKARQNLAVAYGCQGLDELAERQWLRMTEDEPGYRPGWRGLAETYLARGKFAEVDRLVDRLAGDRGMEGEASFLRGKVAEARGDGLAALASFREAARSAGEDLEPLRALAKVLFEHGPAAEADRVLREIVSSDPGDAPSRQNLGSLRLREGRAAEAVDDFLGAIRLRPDCAPTFVLLGRAYKALDRPNEAMDAWEEAFRIAPGDPDATREIRDADRLVPA